MNDLFYAQTGKLVDQIEEAGDIKGLFESRRKIITSSSVDLSRYQHALEIATKSGVLIIPFTDARYPSRLRQTSDPPLLLYVKGKEVDFTRAVAVAGRRDLSLNGHMAAREIGRQLASMGYLVVSGLARGADTEAHCGALEAGGQTVAVLAGWLEDIYPKENSNLARDIERTGALVTMTSPLKRVQKHYFIRRNRITSGVSGCLIIIESDGQGGTARQVDWAIEQGRPVLVLEPDSHSKEAVAAYRSFIKSGARGFSSVRTMMEAVISLWNDSTSQPKTGSRITDYSSP